MAARFTCPACQAALQLRNQLPSGSLIKCPHCARCFPVPATTAAVPVAPLAVPVAPLAAPVATPLATPVAPAAGLDLTPSELPPPPRPTVQRRPAPANPALKWVLVGGGSAFAVGLLVTIGVIWWASSAALPPPVAQAPDRPTPKTRAKVDPSTPKTPAASSQATANVNERADHDHPAARNASRPLPGARAPMADAGAQVDDNFVGWVQDLEDAKNRAARGNKDILILFDGSDWCGWSIRLGFEVLFQREFRRDAPKHFVLVLVDFPKQAKGQAKVENAARNTRLQDQYQVEGYPRVVLTDAQGRPYAFDGYQEGGAQEYLKRLLGHRAVRTQRDALFASVEQAEGAAALPAAKAALDFLEEHDLTSHYAPLVKRWAKLARTHDPKNAQGYSEIFFEMEWFASLARADRDNPKELRQAVARLDDWKASFQFKDANRAARLHLIAAGILSMVDRHEQALAYLKDGRSYNPTDPELQKRLASATAVLGLASGTGFVVAPGGYLLTNHHVVTGRGKTLVRLPGSDTSIRAEVIAHDDKRDLALLRIQLPEGRVLAPLSLGAKPVNRGQKVAVLGFPLGDSVGSGLKLTTGVVSGTPEQGTKNMLLLDAKVNPGNSGGPLCDAAGNVVGMVTAKSFTGRNIDSYGMALPAAELEDFLRKHLNDYAATAARDKPMEWDEVDRLVSPSVLMVLKAP